MRYRAKAAAEASPAPTPRTSEPSSVQAFVTKPTPTTAVPAAAHTIGCTASFLITTIHASTRLGPRNWIVAPGPTPATALVSGAANGAPPGSVAEVSAAGISLTHEIGRRIAASGGFALIIDYAADHGPLGDTLQAVRRHGHHAVLDDPGEADISARVDFSALVRVAGEAGARAFGPVNQGDFLLSLGIEARAKILSRNATSTQRADIGEALGRLVGPGEMGCLFKVLAITAKAAPPPAGFDD